jgi:hypothetical protein
MRYRTNGIIWIFHVIIDEVRIFDIALSDEEITRCMETPGLKKIPIMLSGNTNQKP